MTAIATQRASRTTSGRQTEARANFAQVVEQYQERIFNLAYRMLNDVERARDVTQEAFLQGYRRLETFRGGSALSTWLYRIALNLCRAEYRRDRAKLKPNFVPLPALEARDAVCVWTELHDDSAGPADTVEANERIRIVRRVVAGLEDMLREVVVLREMEGLSYEQIARTLEIPVGTVRSRLFRARNQMRERLWNHRQQGN